MTSGGPELDLANLTRWFEEHVSGFEGPLNLEKFKGGQSNPTYKISTARQDYVLRRKPAGNLVAGAHAVDREARVMAALGGVGFPAPRIHALCQDDSVIGAWFYVMDMVHGRNFWEPALPEVAAAHRFEYFGAMAATMARLHSVDYAAIGLDDYGRAGNYFERQIARWSKQYLGDPGAGKSEDMDWLIDWLSANAPADSATTLIHGDFRFDNLIFDAKAPRIVAVLDWELSTLGDPLADFAYSAMMYHMPAEAGRTLSGCDLRALNIPSEADYVAAYCAQVGRAGIDRWPFYLAFNFFRLAAILHGVRGRYLRGNASSEHAKRRGELFPAVAATGRRLAEAD